METNSKHEKLPQQTTYMTVYYNITGNSGFMKALLTFFTGVGHIFFTIFFSKVTYFSLTH
jgi:hypothetical protein